MRLLDTLPEEKNQIVDCDDSEAITVFKHGVSDEFLSIDFGYFKPKTMSALMEMVTWFCSREESLLAKLRAHDGDPGTSEMKDEHRKSKCNRKNKRENEDGNVDQVNTSFGPQGGDGGPKKKQWKSKKGDGGGSTFDKIMDMVCDYHKP